jgi:Cu-processing system permease protein
MTSPVWRQLWLCAQQELTIAVRSRWTQILAVVFAGLSLAVAGSGYVLSGGSGVQDFARTTTSMVQLVLFVSPMMALLLGASSLSLDQGAAELLFSQPLGRVTVVAGKLLGLLEALTAAQALGFGAAGLVIFSQAGGEGAASYALRFAGAVVLTAVFLGIAALLAAGAGSGRRGRALAAAVVVWFVAVVLADVVALGVASLLRSGPASRVLIVATLANPVDAVRTGLLLAIQGTTAFGAASLALLRFTSGPAGAGMLIAGSLLLWLALPTAAAAYRIRRADV